MPIAKFKFSVVSSEQMDTAASVGILYRFYIVPKNYYIQKQYF